MYRQVIIMILKLFVDVSGQTPSLPSVLGAWRQQKENNLEEILPERVFLYNVISLKSQLFS